MTDPVLLLASASPRRAELLDQVGVGWRRVRVSVPEDVHAGEAAGDYVVRVALAKARAGIQARETDLPVLGADTAVVVDGDILGKPADGVDAARMLGRLSGREHEVYSAVAVCDGDIERTAVSVTRVSFRVLTDAEISAYWQTGEPADKAGAYGIQGLGAAFVFHISGSYSGVMGLPLFETCRLLADFAIPVPRPASD